MTAKLRVLTLERLAKGDIPGITAVKGAAHVEACLIQLDSNAHAAGVPVAAGGDISGEPLQIDWTTPVTDQMRRTWNDAQEALEEGAAGIAVLTLLEYTDFTVVERACKGTGVDYWLSEQDDGLLFQKAARLEVSGIERESFGNTVAQRVKVKKRQTARSDGTALPAYVAVVEFGSPQTHLERKK